MRTAKTDQTGPLCWLCHEAAQILLRWVACSSSCESNISIYSQGGLALGDYGMRPGDDKSIDRKQQFMPVVPPTVVSLLLCSALPRMFCYLGRVKRFCVFEHSVMTNFNCACPAIQRGQGSGFLSEGSSWLNCLYERAAKVLARLRGCAGSPEPSLLT